MLWQVEFIDPSDLTLLNERLLQSLYAIFYLYLDLYPLIVLNLLLFGEIYRFYLSFERWSLIELYQNLFEYIFSFF